MYVVVIARFYYLAVSTKTLAYTKVVTVAHVLQIRHLGEAFRLEIEDGTRNGTLTAHRWLDQQPRVDLPTDDKPFYARIIGKLKPGSDKHYPHELEIKIGRAHV